MARFGRQRRALAAAIAAVACQILGSAAKAASIDPVVEAILEQAHPTDELPIIVRLRSRDDVSKFRHYERRARRRETVRSLRKHASRSQRHLRRLMRRAGTDVRNLWAINALALDARPALIERLARRQDVDRIDFDDVVVLSGSTGAPTSAVEWNLDLVRAPDAWALGFDGEGVVIGLVDSGVDATHPDLAASWRGGAGSWLDLVDGTTAPHDTGGGHGTQVAGILVGGDAGGTHVGVAPGAEWIAARAFDLSGTANFSDLHAALAWMLDPDGDAMTDDAPDVVNNSWVIANAAGLCLSEFDADVDLLRAAGIAVVFAAGNSGPNASSDASPANADDTLAVGAIDAANNVAFGSARGPSSCGGSLFPNLVAPGVSVWTTDRFLLPPAYTSVSGTSYAAPHVTAAIAVLLEAFPGTPLVEVENFLEMSAADIAAIGPGNDSGHGVLDVRSALGLLVDAHGCPTGAAAVDTDLDGRADACDTCTVVADPLHRDTDGDGFGNVCDGDFSNDGIVNFGDLGAFAMAFGTKDPDTDLNGDGIVNFGDLALFTRLFGRPPGPSGYHY